MRTTKLLGLTTALGLCLGALTAHAQDKKELHYSGWINLYPHHAAAVGTIEGRFEEQFPDVEKKVLVVAGGVAANRTLRNAFDAVCAEAGFHLSVPPAELCTDNAAMVAWAGALRLSQGRTDAMDAPARARWPLDPDAQPVPFAGVKA